MNKIMKSPVQYIQSPGLLGQFLVYFKDLGKHPLILMSGGGTKCFRARLEGVFSSISSPLHFPFLYRRVLLGRDSAHSRPCENSWHKCSHRH